MRHLVAAAVMALALPGAASAVTFSGAWNVSGSALSDPGLVVGAAGPSAFSFDLEDGGSTSFKLFRIYTGESDVGSDDLDPQGLDVGFALTSHAAGGTVGGTSIGRKFFGFQWGEVAWSGPVEIDVGTGLLSVLLSDAKHFNKGLFGLSKGEKHGADVYATVSYAAVAPVPLPAGLPLVLVGLGALGCAGFRRKAPAA